MSRTCNFASSVVYVQDERASQRFLLGSGSNDVADTNDLKYQKNDQLGRLTALWVQRGEKPEYLGNITFNNGNDARGRQGRYGSELEAFLRPY